MHIVGYPEGKMKNDTVKSVREIAINTIKDHDMLAEGYSVVLGFSGGPDSICLFDILLSIKDELNLNVYPVHINHNLRGEAALSDQKFCEEFSESKGLICHVFSFDCEADAKEFGITTEEAGRNYRYKAYGEVAKIAKNEHPENNVVIAVAQNADDRAETVIMRILRGTGPDGLQGIPYKRGFTDEFTVIRPLLDIYKEDIIEYCNERGLNPRMDHTNSEPVYRRNQIRLSLIPELERFNPKVKEALNRLAVYAGEDREFLESMAEEIYLSIRETEKTEDDIEKGIGTVIFDVKTLLWLNPSIKRRVIALALRDIGLTEDVSAAHYEAIYDLLQSKNPSSYIDLPNAYAAWREYEKIVFGPAHIGKDEKVDLEGKFSQEQYSAKLFLDEQLSVGQLTERQCSTKRVSVKYIPIEEFDSMELVPHTYAAFDYDLITRDLGNDWIDKLTVRGRKPGDIIRLNGGSKKIQDLLVDLKIPVREREEIDLLACGNEVLWMMNPPRYSSKWRISEATKTIAYIVLIV